jgi:hypothetical protein
MPESVDCMKFLIPRPRVESSDGIPQPEVHLEQFLSNYLSRSLSFPPDGALETRAFQPSGWRMLAFETPFGTFYSSRTSRATQTDASTRKY